MDMSPKSLSFLTNQLIYPYIRKQLSIPWVLAHGGWFILGISDTSKRECRKMLSTERQTKQFALAQFCTTNNDITGAIRTETRWWAETVCNAECHGDRWQRRRGREWEKERFKSPVKLQDSSRSSYATVGRPRHTNASVRCWTWGATIALRARKETGPRGALRDADVRSRRTTRRLRLKNWDFPIGTVKWCKWRKTTLQLQITPTPIAFLGVSGVSNCPF